MKSELFDVTTTRHKDDVLLQPFFSPKKIIKKNLDKKVFFKVTKNSKQMCKVFKVSHANTDILEVYWCFSGSVLARLDRTSTKRHIFIIVYQSILKLLRTDPSFSSALETLPSVLTRCCQRPQFFGRNLKLARKIKILMKLGRMFHLLVTFQASQRYTDYNVVPLHYYGPSLYHYFDAMCISYKL